MVPVPFRVARDAARDRATRGRSSSSPRTARAPARFAPGPVHDALRLRRRRGADLGQRRPGDAGRARAHRSARSARSTARALRAAAAARSLGRARARSAPRGRWPRREGRDVVIVAGGIGLAPLRPGDLPAARAPRALRRVALLYGGRTPGDLLFPRASSSAGARARPRGGGHRRQRAGATGAAASGVVTDADPARGVRPRRRRGDGRAGPR